MKNLFTIMRGKEQIREKLTANKAITFILCIDNPTWDNEETVPDVNDGLGRDYTHLLLTRGKQGITIWAPGIYSVCVCVCVCVCMC